MKVLVVYYSQTNNTKLIAQSMYDVLNKEHEADIKSLKETTYEDLKGNDVVFLGAACHDSSLAMPMIKFLRGLPEDLKLKIAGFYTHSVVHADGTERHDQLFKDWAGLCEKEFERVEKIKNKELVGVFHCQGKASFLIEKFIRVKTMRKKSEWVPYKEEMRKHPDISDVMKAKEFAKEVMSNI